MPLPCPLIPPHSPTCCSKSVEARLEAWHAEFLAELAAAKRAFESIKAELPPGSALPPHAGRVALLQGLLRRVQRPWEHLLAMAGGSLPAVAKAAESAAAYGALGMGLQQAISHLHAQVGRWQCLGFSV